jgi:hypothetical protein
MRAGFVCLLGAAAVLALSAAAAQEPFSPEMKRLEFLIGEAKAKGKLYLPGQPGGLDWEANDRGAWVLGGSYLKTESRSNITGIGALNVDHYLSYDPKEKLYRQWSFLSIAALPMELSGGFDGPKLVMISKPFDAPGLGTRQYRATVEPKPGNEVYFLMEIKIGERFEKFQEGTYTVSRG